MRSTTSTSGISKFSLSSWLFLFAIVGLAAGCTKGGTNDVAHKVHSVHLTWMASASPVVGYNIYRANALGDAYFRQNTSLITITQYEDVNVEPGHTYFYNVTAVDGKGVESRQSTEVSAQVPTR